jgi:hypothetical protein
MLHHGCPPAKGKPWPAVPTHTPGHVAGRIVPTGRERLPVPNDPHPARVVQTAAGFEVVGVALVTTDGRRSDTARRLADRIARRPLVYLPLCLWLDIPGVTDLRPTFGRRKAVAHG